jgi:hypothetical protein
VAWDDGPPSCYDRALHGRGRCPRLAFYRDYTRAAPDELSAAAGVLTGPDGNLAASILVSYWVRLWCQLRTAGGPEKYV